MLNPSSNLLAQAREMDRKEHKRSPGKQEWTDAELLERLVLIVGYLNGNVSPRATAILLKAKQGSLIALAAYTIRDALKRNLCEIVITSHKGKG